jgi:hypothetical protein
LKNKPRAVSQGDDWLEARRLERQEAKKSRKGFASSFPVSQRSIFGHKMHLQKPRAAGSRPEARFFNSLLKGMDSQKSHHNRWLCKKPKFKARDSRGVRRT